MRARRPFLLFTLATLVVAGCTADKAKQPVTTAAASMQLWDLSTKSEEAQKLLADGDRLADAGFQLAAHEQFKRAIVADSNSAYAYMRYAETSYSTTEFVTYIKRAESHLQTANAAEKAMVQANSKANEGDVQGAIDLVKQLVAANPNSPRAHVVLAGYQIAVNQIPDARASLQKAITLAPTVGLPSLNLAASYLFNEPKDFALADKYATAGQKLWPNEPLSYDVIGRVRRAQSRLDEAAAAYTKEIELNPKESQGYAVRGNAYTFLGQYDKARADYDQAIRVSRPPEIPFNANTKALITAYAGDWKGSIAELDQAMQATAGMQLEDPNGPTAQAASWAILIALEHKDIATAEKEYPKLEAAANAQAEKSGSAGFKRFIDGNLAYARGLIAVFKGDYATTQKSIDEIIKFRAPDNDPTKDRTVHELRGFLALFQKKDYATAAAELKQGDPGDMFIQYYVAIALEGAGKGPESKTAFQKLANYNFTDGTYAAIRNDAIAKAQ